MQCPTVEHILKTKPSKESRKQIENLLSRCGALPVGGVLGSGLLGQNVNLLNSVRPNVMERVLKPKSRGIRGLLQRLTLAWQVVKGTDSTRKEGQGGLGEPSLKTDTSLYGIQIIPTTAVGTSKSTVMLSNKVLEDYWRDQRLFTILTESGPTIELKIYKL